MSYEEKLAQFGESIKGKSREELCELHRALMHKDEDKSFTAEDITPESDFVLDCAKIALVEEAIMKIDVPSGNLDIEYTDGTKKTVKVW
jgi:hypothetical protein